MLNYIGTGLISYLLGQVFNDEGSEYAANLIPQTTPLPETGQMPSLNNFLNLKTYQDLHGFLFVAIIVGIFYYWLVWKTTLGFDLKNNWSNPSCCKI